MFDFLSTHRFPIAIALGATVVLTLLQQGDDAQIARGRALFDHPFTPAEGVGSPEMNADTCRGCHQDPSIGGSGGLELNVSRFGHDNGGLGPFQDLPGGQGLSKLHPPNAPWREEAPVEADCFEQRQTPSLFGSGLIDSIPDFVIIANEDPQDLDGDGIRGVARRIVIGGLLEIGRFGWKAQAPRLADFVRDAAMGEMGITTSSNGRGFGAAVDSDGVADPELGNDQIADIAAFMASLPAPQRVGSTDPAVMQGEQVFYTVGCVKCHMPALSGSGGPVPLYSDLLLHNVMPTGFRGMSEPGATSGYYRTPPLWGVRNSAPYMHDGRAEDLLAAVMAHDGEAAQVRTNFSGMAAADQAALIKFLGDL